MTIKITRNHALDQSIGIEIKVSELLCLVRSLGYHIEHNENISSWSSEADLYDDLVNILEQAMTQLADSANDVNLYHTPVTKAKSIIHNRKAEDAA